MPSYTYKGAFNLCFMKKNLVLIILYLAFISIGLPDSIWGVAWPTMRLDFGQSIDSLGFLVSIITLSSAIAGYTSGYISKRFDVGTILLLSTIFIIIGFMGYITTTHWIFILMFAIPCGLGGGAIDCALNNYAAKNFSSRHVNWLHGFWGIGTTIGPIILTSLYIFDLSWKVGFLVILIIQIVFLVIFFKTKNIWAQANIEPTESANSKNYFISFDGILSSLFFGFYVSLEASIGLWYSSYIIDYKNLSKEYAGLLISLYWGVFTFGRFVVGVLTKWVSDNNIITVGIIVAGCSLILMYFGFDYAIIFTGFALSGIYPCMINLTHKRFKPQDADAIMGQQIGTSYLSLVALVPLIGYLSEKFGLQYLMLMFLTLSVLLLILNIRLSKLKI